MVRGGTRIGWPIAVAGMLVLLSAAIHFVLGGIGLYEALVLGDGEVFLPTAYVVAGILALSLVWASASGWIAPVPAYVTATVLMLFYVVAYVDWHVLGYAESVLPFEGVEHDHGHDDHGSGHGHGSHEESTIESLVDHLLDDPFALVSKTAELIAAVILGVLAIVNRG